MKTRIIKHTHGGDVWYTVQYKRLLFWHTWTDLYDCDVRFTDINEALHDAQYIATKETKEIVEQ